MEKPPQLVCAAEALFVVVHCVWVVEMSRFAPKEEGIDLRVMPTNERQIGHLDGPNYSSSKAPVYSW